MHYYDYLDNYCDYLERDTYNFHCYFYTRWNRCAGTKKVLSTRISWLVQRCDCQL